MDFDPIYRSTEHYFGTEPNALLREYRGQMDTSHRVLDLGAGQGRNALFLAQQGFGVDAVDPSRMAIETIATTAAAGQKLDIRTYRCSFETLAPDVGKVVTHAWAEGVFRKGA